MKNFFNRHINKISLIAVLFVALVALTSCRSGKWPSTVYTTWGAEFKFSSFMQGLTGWPVAILSYPIAWLMHLIGDLLGDSYAWGLIFTTIIVRTIAWPIYSKQNDSSIKMQLIQPEMEKIQRKYAGKQDPESQRRMQAETMGLYKKYKLNPFGCVFTMFIQFPIFMGMYEAVRRVNLVSSRVIEGGATTVVEAGKFALSNTKLFGYFELDSSFTGAEFIHDKIFVVVLALLFSGITFLSQKLAAKQPSYVKKRPNSNPNQMANQMKMMNYVMIVMFFVMSLSNTSLALYWLVGGIYQLGQSQVGRVLNEKKYYKLQNKLS